LPGTMKTVNILKLKTFNGVRIIRQNLHWLIS